jgi:hypothetical protein
VESFYLVFSMPNYQDVRKMYLEGTEAERQKNAYFLLANRRGSSEVAAELMELLLLEHNSRADKMSHRVGDKFSNTKEFFEQRIQSYEEKLAREGNVSARLKVASK